MTISTPPPPPLSLASVRIPTGLPRDIVVRHVAQEAGVALLASGHLVPLAAIDRTFWSVQGPVDVTVDDALFKLVLAERYGATLSMSAETQAALAAAWHITRETLPGTMRGEGWGFDLERWTVYIGDGSPGDGSSGLTATLYMAALTAMQGNTVRFISEAEAEYRMAAGPFAPYPPEPASDDDW